MGGELDLLEFKFLLELGDLFAEFVFLFFEGELEFVELEFKILVLFY